MPQAEFLDAAGCDVMRGVFVFSSEGDLQMGGDPCC